jgi:hypothetical protein
VGKEGSMNARVSLELIPWDAVGTARTWRAEQTKGTGRIHRYQVEVTVKV